MIQVLVDLVPVCSMVPLLLKDGLLAPYAVTSLAFLFFGVYLLSALERCSEQELRMGAYRKLFFFLPGLDMGRIVKWKVGALASPQGNCHFRLGKKVPQIVTYKVTLNST